MDAGSARDGWYGGALTFYSGDVIETLPRESDTNVQWYMLTGYTDWRGKHVFFDTKLDLGYGNLTASAPDHRRPGPRRRRQARRPAGRAGRHRRRVLQLWRLQIMPHVSLDGLTMREEGYTEAGGGDGLDLQVAPYYANSLRGFLGADFKKSSICSAPASRRKRGWAIAMISSTRR